MILGPHPVLQTLSLPFARLSFVETCGPRWQRAKFGSVLRKRLQAVAYGRTNSSSFSASGPCHLHGRQKKRERERHDGCLKVVAGPRPSTADVLRLSSAWPFCLYPASLAQNHCYFTCTLPLGAHGNVHFYALIGRRCRAAYKWAAVISMLHSHIELIGGFKTNWKFQSTEASGKGIFLPVC